TTERTNKQQNQQKKPKQRVKKLKITLESPFVNIWKVLNLTDDITSQLHRLLDIAKSQQNVCYIGVNEVTSILNRVGGGATLVLIFDNSHTKYPPVLTEHIKSMCLLNNIPLGIFNQQLSGASQDVCIAFTHSPILTSQLDEFKLLLPSHGELSHQDSTVYKSLVLGQSKPVVYKRVIKK
ncbi:hypothetical protein AKO1_003476, partial [Acrasis kona]